MSKPMDELFHHDYDGIQEYDNPMPFWWLGLFYLTIFWGVVYVIWFHILAFGNLQQAEYYKEVDPTWVNPNPPFAILKPYYAPYEIAGLDMTPWLRAKLSGTDTPTAVAAEVQEAVSIEALTDAAMLADGRAIYEKNCVSCHGSHGQGGIGPNLADDYWLHGQGDINGIATVVKYGVPVKGMIAWGKVLSEDDWKKVSSYVLTIRGTNPPNPKAPQGKQITQ